MYRKLEILIFNYLSVRNQGHCLNNLQIVKANKSGDFRVTHQATANRWSLSAHMVSIVARFCFCDGRTDGRTDTLSENNDHLSGRGLGGSISDNFDRAMLTEVSYFVVRG